MLGGGEANGDIDGLTLGRVFELNPGNQLPKRARFGSLRFVKGRQYVTFCALADFVASSGVKESVTRKNKTGSGWVEKEDDIPKLFQVCIGESDVYRRRGRIWEKRARNAKINSRGSVQREPQGGCALLQEGDLGVGDAEVPYRRVTNLDPTSLRIWHCEHIICSGLCHMVLDILLIPLIPI
eukprot:Gb_23647 [translate_table: standard]